MVTESKGTTVVAGLIHKGPTVSYRYTTLLDATGIFSVLPRKARMVPIATRAFEKAEAEGGFHY